MMETCRKYRIGMPPDGGRYEAGHASPSRHSARLLAAPHSTVTKKNPDDSRDACEGPPPAALRTDAAHEIKAGFEGAASPAGAPDPPDKASVTGGLGRLMPREEDY